MQDTCDERCCHYAKQATLGGVHCVHAGEKLQDADVDSILKFTGTEEDLDGNIKYEGKLYDH